MRNIEFLGMFKAAPEFLVGLAYYDISGLNDEEVVFLDTFLATLPPCHIIEFLEKTWDNFGICDITGSFTDCIEFKVYYPNQGGASHA